MATQSQEASPSPTDDGALRANVKTCEVCSWTSTRASEFAYLYKLIGEFRNVICAADAKRVSGKSSLRELQWLQTRAPSHTLPCIVRAHGRPCRTQEGYTRQYKCVEMVKFLDLLPQTFSWALSLASSTSMRSSPRSTSERATSECRGFTWFQRASRREVSWTCYKCCGEIHERLVTALVPG